MRSTQALASLEAGFASARTFDFCGRRSVRPSNKLEARRTQIIRRLWLGINIRPPNFCSAIQIDKNTGSFLPFLIAARGRKIYTFD
jgi:hypothetical protein